MMMALPLAISKDTDAWQQGEFAWFNISHVLMLKQMPGQENVTLIYLSDNSEVRVRGHFDFIGICMCDLMSRSSRPR